MAIDIAYEPGRALPAPVPAGTTSGQPLRIGGLNAVAVTDRAKRDVPAVDPVTGLQNAAYNWGGGNQHGNASVWFEGVVLVPVTSATAPAYGSSIYIITASRELTTTASGNTLWGYAVDLSPTVAGTAYKTLVRIAN